MATLAAGFLEYLRKTNAFPTRQMPMTSAGKAAEVALAAEHSVRSFRELAGGHYPAGTLLVHLRCLHCGKRVATIETGEDGEIVTFWRGRRFPGVPAVECPDHGRLVLETGALADKMRVAPYDRRPP